MPTEPRVDLEEVHRSRVNGSPLLNASLHFSDRGYEAPLEGDHGLAAVFVSDMRQHAYLIDAHERGLLAVNGTALAQRRGRNLVGPPGRHDDVDDLGIGLFKHLTVVGEDPGHFPPLGGFLSACFVYVTQRRQLNVGHARN